MTQVKIEDILPKLLEVLQLPDGVTAETVTADQINGALDGLISEEQVEQMENERKAACNRSASLLQILMNRDLGALGITDPTERKTLSDTLAKSDDYEATVAVLIRNRASAVSVEVPKPLHNRKAATTPGAVTDGVNNAAEEAKAKRISNRAAELKKSLGISHSEAFSRARAEFEETAKS